MQQRTPHVLPSKGAHGPEQSSDYTQVLDSSWLSFFRVSPQACPSYPALDQSNYQFSSQDAALNVEYNQSYQQVSPYQENFESSHPSAIMLSSNYVDRPAFGLQSSNDHSTYIYPPPISAYNPPISGDLCTRPTHMEALEYNDLLWNPVVLPNMHQTMLPNSSYPVQYGNLDGSPDESTVEYPGLFGYCSPPQEWEGSITDPFPPHQVLFNPVVRSNSESSLSSLSDDHSIVPITYASSPTPMDLVQPLSQDPSSTALKVHEATDSATPFNYDDALRQFKSAKRQRRIIIKSKVTSSSGASIPISSSTTEFTPTYSEKDQLWYCNVCGKGIKRHGDVIRHWRSYNCPVRKAACAGTKKRLVCPFPSCKYSTGRRDGLSRHLNVHRPAEE